jgi:N-sulfoglucosamine sulfohydrolase
MAMNFVYLHSHDTGQWISPYGYSCPTPAYQGFAEQGMVFRNAFCAAPTCCPSRAAMMTGMSAHACGMIGLTHRGFKVNDPGQHLASYLRTQGYETYLSGVMHESQKAKDFGYEVIGEHSHHPHGPAVGFLKSRKPGDGPFMLTVGWGNTHRRFPAAAKDSQWTDSRYAGVHASLPDSATVREDVAAFNTSLRELDRELGEVLAAIDAAGLRESTLVLVTTDHGPPFPGMKSTCTDLGTGVLMMLRGPGGFTGGKVSDALVSHLDVFPTVCDVLGLARPGWLEGLSLLPLADGSQKEVRDEVYSEITYHACYEPVRSVRTGRYRYIRRFDVPARKKLITGNVDAGMSKAQMLGDGWGDLETAAEEFYDLKLDPMEKVNLAGSAEHQAALHDHRVRLAAWMERTGDPLVAGHVEAPADAQVGLQTDVNPKDTVLTGKAWNEVLRRELGAGV